MEIEIIEKNNPKYSKKNIKFKNTLKKNKENNLKIVIKTAKILIYYLIMVNIPAFNFKGIKNEYTKLIKDKNKYNGSCINNNIYKYEYNNICYISCPKETHISSNNKYLCLKNNQEKKKQKKDNINNLVEISKNIPESHNFRKLSDNNIDNIIFDIKTKFKNGTYDSEINNLINGVIIKGNEIILQIISTNNQNDSNNEYKNISIINLGECEILLKKYYNILESIPLIIFKIDYYKEGLMVPIIEYEVYNSETKDILNLDLCKDIGITILTPLLIEYKEDICVPLCDDNCKGLGYDLYTKKYNCKCSIKSKMNLISEIKIQKWNQIGYFDNFCKIKNNDYDEKDNPYFKDEIIKNIKEEIQNGTLDKILPDILYDDGEDIIINKSNIIYQITSSNHQNFEENKNLSIIRLGNCENILKNHYNIDSSIPLLIFKYDYYREGSSAPIVGYEVYNSKTNEKLDLNYCGNEKIDIEIPVSINESDISKYEIITKYYNDSCYTYSTHEGDDIILDNEYIYNNSLCGSNCIYEGYDYGSKKAKCECQAKSQFSLISEISNIKDKLIESFNDLKKSNISKCFKFFFSKEGFKDNIGNYILLGIIVINIILNIIMINQGKNLIQKEINKILKINVENKNISDVNNNKLNNSNRYNNKKKLNDSNRYYNKDKKSNIDNICENSIINIENNYDNKSVKSNKKNREKKKKKENKNENVEIIQFNSNPSKKLKNKKVTDKESKISPDLEVKPDSKIELDNSDKKKNIAKKRVAFDLSLLNKKKNGEEINQINDMQFEKFNDYELNKLHYNEAILYDKRVYFQYYISLVKRNNLFIFAFISTRDYNPKLLKISIFLFSLCLYFAMNVVFIDDLVIRIIYEQKDTFILGHQIPQIVYSIIVSAIFIGIIKFIFLSEKDIMQIRKIKEKEYVNGKSTKIINYVRCKVILFFITNMIFQIIFWIYVGLFCAVFKNTQIFLIKKTLITYIFYLLYPFVFCFFPGIFRILSLKSPDKSWMYKISKILQNI